MTKTFGYLANFLHPHKTNKKTKTKETLHSLHSLSLSDLQAERFMLHRTSRLAGVTFFRRFTTGYTEAPAVAEQYEEKMFKEAWTKVVPHVNPPKLPLCFMKPLPQLPSLIPSKLTLNLLLPHSSNLFNNEQVDMVTLPATTGEMGILPGHTTTMTELNPGILLLHQESIITKCFVSGGFAFVHPNSVVDIITLEAVPIDRIDPNMVEKGLAEFRQKLTSATTDYEKAEAQVGLDVHNALQHALTS